MVRAAWITDIIARLQALRQEHGDLEVDSVNYHSDFTDIPLQVGNDEQIKVENGRCLIYGGGY